MRNKHDFMNLFILYIFHLIQNTNTKCRKTKVPTCGLLNIFPSEYLSLYSMFYVWFWDNNKSKKYDPVYIHTYLHRFQAYICVCCPFICLQANGDIYFGHLKNKIDTTIIVWPSVQPKLMNRKGFVYRGM